MSTTSAGAILGVSFSMIVLATITTGLRLYSRRAQNARFGPDDWVVIPAWIFFIVTAGITVWLVLNNMLGISSKAMNAAHISFILRYKVFLANDVAGCVSEGLTRISALLFLRRIFCVTDRGRWLAITIWAGIALLVLWMIAFITIPLLQCGPNLAEALGGSLKVAAKDCDSGLGPIYVESYTLSNAIMEALIIALPIPLVLSLHTSLKRRLSVLLVFGTAFLSLGSSIARANAAVNQNHLTTTEEQDDTDNRLAFFFILGPGTALIAVNLPSVYWIIQKAKPEQLMFSLRSLLRTGSWSRASSSNKSGLQGQVQSSNGGFVGLYKDPSASATEKDGGIHKTYTIDVSRNQDSPV